MEKFEAKADNPQHFTKPVRTYQEKKKEEMEKVALIPIYKMKYVLLTFSEKTLRWLKKALTSMQSPVNCSGKPHSLQYCNCPVCHHWPQGWLSSTLLPPRLILWITWRHTLHFEIKLLLFEVWSLAYQTTYSVFWATLERDCCYLTEASNKKMRF